MIPIIGFDSKKKSFNVSLLDVRSDISSQSINGNNDISEIRKVAHCSPKFSPHDILN
jgi:hypothetical protein